ncbi:CLUMA_CG012287, isoform A [Clunio marinus]|uniref:CLUMA_CG012287, isoform A n=1 Tax=Clunio marinus TaxID=568069 RepID=A0A1J1IEK8_9DIPT|nr:CLUMA_CG012287, isoform A [Clunio marinus]
MYKNKHKKTSPNTYHIIKESNSHKNENEGMWKDQTNKSVMFSTNTKSSGRRFKLIIVVNKHEKSPQHHLLPLQHSKRSYGERELSA